MNTPAALVVQHTWESDPFLLNNNERAATYMENFGLFAGAKVVHLFRLSVFIENNIDWLCESMIKSLRVFVFNNKASTHKVCGTTRHGDRHESVVDAKRQDMSAKFVGAELRGKSSSAVHFVDPNIRRCMIWRGKFVSAFRTIREKHVAMIRIRWRQGRLEVLSAYLALQNMSPPGPREENR